VVPSLSGTTICLLLLWKSLHRETVRGQPIKMSIKVNTFKEVMYYAMSKKGAYICIMPIKLTRLLQIISFHLEV